MAAAEVQKTNCEQRQQDSNATDGWGKRKRADRCRDDKAREEVHGEVEAVGCYGCHE